jgi:hypothetical protein
MVRGTMSAAIKPEHYKWIAFAHLIATGEIPACPQLRNTVRVLLAALNSPSRRSVIEFLGLVYRHEKGQTVRGI